MKSSNIKKRRVCAWLKRFTDDDFGGLFSNEFIEKFDYDLNYVAAKYTPDKNDKEELNLNSSLLEMVRSGNATYLFDDFEGWAEDYFTIEYDIANNLKLYDVCSVEYLFLSKDEKIKETLDYCDEVFVSWEMLFLVMGKEYRKDQISLTLIPVSSDFSNELQIRLTSGKF